MVTLGLVVATFNAPVTDKMAASARSAAEEAGVDIAAEIEVPGAYDTPLAADRLARRDDIDAVAVVGAIITGDTDHDDVIGTAAAQKLTEVSLERDTPVAMGITGPGQSADEARARTDYGARAVESAIDLATELEDL
ncbi:6,7-dimethyl-8-ribityllumazine synthase [Natranaeroarchaeum aerophilus]|uniref:6,7-dimethyl-8-ribityllumazine synthase n=1 Tax=Natranaeroarchaeum aerophilus TaxID=2917711 RepID=A0AAE3FTB4_9EURY|nr:6,7-dimethyl-8-ribityllumazine synthase [Natranaeroarchaeum aerophilus]MCL9814943.1 6,7-dimethyl-8-ribityllumazine synthase [Natranaeroarchaeum aerophilus]